MAFEMDELSEEFLVENGIANLPLKFTTEDGRIGHIQFLKIRGVLKTFISVSGEQQLAERQHSRAQPHTLQPAIVEPQANVVRRQRVLAQPMPKQQANVLQPPQPPQQQQPPQPPQQQNYAEAPAIRSQRFVKPNVQIAKAPSQKLPVRERAHPIQAPAENVAVEQCRFRIDKGNPGWNIFVNDKKLEPYDFEDVDDQDVTKLKLIYFKKVANISIYSKNSTGEYYLKLGDTWMKYITA
jgi:hypothetical protein